MSITYENSEVKFESVIYEDEVVSFRDFLQEKAGEEISLNFIECEDIHFAVMQLIMAYKKSYSCSYTFSADEKRLYQIVLEGFTTSENHCS